MVTKTRKQEVRDLVVGSPEYEEFDEIRNKLWHHAAEMSKLRKRLKEMGLENDISGNPKNYRIVRK